MDLNHIELRNSNLIFESYLSKVYDAAKSSLQHAVRYTDAGWANLNNQHRYLSGNDQECSSKICLADTSKLPPKTICEMGWKVLRLSKFKKISLPLFLQMHAGPMFKIFSDAQIPIQFVFVINGTRESGKTTVAKILYKLFHRRNVNFISKPRAIEIYLEQCQDLTAFFDDLSSVLDNSQLKILEKYVVRPTGDNIGRSKSENGGQDFTQVEVKCSVVITSEKRPETLQTSSQIRLLVVNVDKTAFEEDVVKDFKKAIAIADINKMPQDLEVYISAFIHFLERHYDELVMNFMNCQCDVPKKELKSKRLRQVWCIFSCIAKTVLQFAVESEFISKEEADKMLEEDWLPMIREWLIENDQESNKTEPYQLFLKTIANGISQNLISISDSKEAFQKEAGDHIGFWEDNKYLLKLDPNRIFEYARKYNRNKGFDTTETALWKELLEKGFSNGYEQKNHAPKLLQKIKVNDISINTLCLNWNKIQLFLDEE